jgi:dihydrofolate synthase/folylpolyglutamate synthase
VDVAVVEVGLGGRLDSTNVITPLLSVITNISYDHQNMLGDTLPEIAFEKAGIIKPNVPVVIGETHPESAPVFLKKAAETGSEIIFADRHFEAREKGEKNWKSTFYDVFKDGKLFLENLEVDAAGPFQAKNVATAIQALEVVSNNLPMLDLHALQAGLKNLRPLTQFIGRWQIIGTNPTILCDSAHNEAGLKMAFEKIAQLTTYDLRLTTDDFKLQTPNFKLHVVTGFVNDKDVDKILGLFPKNARYYFAKADIPRGLEATLLQEKAASQGLKGRAYSSVKNALKAAKRAAAPQDLIVIIGSIFVVAEVI